MTFPYTDISNEKVTEALVNFCNAVEAACVDLKRQLGEAMPLKPMQPQTLKEERFTALKWESQHGDKLGDYETASKKNNPYFPNSPDRWSQAYTILTQCNATIQSPYKSSGHTHRYWLYGEEKIYRKKV